MFSYKFKQRSVIEQQHIRSVYKKYAKRKRIFLLAFFGILTIGIVYFANHKKGSEVPQVAAADTFVPAPQPTEINANFINQVNKCFLPAAAAYGYTLRITSGFRSDDEQDELYMQGRTVDGHIVTEAPAGKSIHNYGYAVDVADRDDGFDIDWEKLGRIGAYCGLEQGDEGDQAHFEHRGGLTTDQFKEGHRPADLTLPCQLMEDRYNANQPLTKADLASCSAPDFNAAS